MLRSARFPLAVVIALSATCAFSGAVAAHSNVGTPPPDGNNASHPHRLLLDVAGNGLDLSGTNPQLKTRWTKPRTDDAFAAVDADDLYALGYRISLSGQPLRGTVLFASGLRFARPDGTTQVVQDGWAVLDVLDSNRDGFLDARDPTWPALRLFVDSDGDGSVAAAEVERVTDLRRIGPRLRDHGERVVDGATLTVGIFLRNDETSGVAADAALAHVD